ncbi:MAG: hypothetical protein RIS06_1040, partial [Actinomycetota bacterium]
IEPVVFALIDECKAIGQSFIKHYYRNFPPGFMIVAFLFL